MTDDVPVPATRWELGGAVGSTYAADLAGLLDDGVDVDGEARLADVLAPRGARVLDAGSGLGRVADALRRRGHDATAVEKDPALVATSRERFPEVPVLEADLLALSPAALAARGRASSYDVVVLVGNVMVYLAPDTEVRALTTVRDLLAPEGRVLVGFHPVAGPAHSRDYPWAEFAGHVEASGLEVVHRFGSYELAAPSDDYVVAVLALAR